MSLYSFRSNAQLSDRCNWINWTLRLLKIRMNPYSFIELADVQLAFGVAGKNDRRAEQMYVECNLNRHTAQHQRLHVFFDNCKTGSLVSNYHYTGI
ncbi:hypothetical protein NPIL_433221 [Nephila pilipes]|uniref:Uncharacterized protein n=1 Tax=Nephila pilipes TaxID=299642 RepID=A0A8X6U911_NEPPI|nr:hypothetical protein NPIL_433221 [Nephila pilipes]